jgi:hypothetical protein
LIGPVSLLFFSIKPGTILMKNIGFYFTSGILFLNQVLTFIFNSSSTILFIIYLP